MTTPIILPPAPSFREAVSPSLRNLLAALQERQANALRQRQLDIQEQTAQAQIAQSEAQTAAINAASGAAAAEAKGKEEAARAVQQMISQVSSPDQITMPMMVNALAQIKTPQGIMAFLQAVPGLKDVVLTPGMIGAESQELEQKRIMGGMVNEWLKNPNAKINFKDITRADLLVASALDLAGVYMSGLQTLMEREKMNTQLDMMTRQTVMEAWGQVFNRYKMEAEAYQTGFQKTPPDLNKILDETTRTMLNISGDEFRQLMRSTAAATLDKGGAILSGDPSDISVNNPPAYLSLLETLPEDTRAALMEEDQTTQEDIILFARQLLQSGMKDLDQATKLNGLEVYGEKWPQVLAKIHAVRKALEKNVRQEPAGEPGRFRKLWDKIRTTVGTQREGASNAPPKAPTGGVM